MYNDDVLMSGLTELGLNPTAEQIAQLHTYYEMMVATNEVMNLTAITEYEEVCVKHWLDSLCLVKAISVDKLNTPLRLIDVGTGAGFPGIPLKILFPSLKVTLMDALGKRIRFLEEVVAALGLSNVTCVHGRAEELGRNTQYREQFDLCTSRAVTRMASLTEFCLPLTAVGGAMVAYKSQDCEEELTEAAKAIRTLGGNLEDTVKFTVPNSDFGRSLIVVRKEKATPAKYPRGGGKPMKSPIL
ncbi:MAG: 16S rRNA (guanine(527)-N(7))-methyltransferase RsmG [Lachnospiraceae bacterium]|nr:16S rRNA (guanine(527)-N(7))-methyltransferase RsmG [Lachnospiraceae bacterium]MBR6018632.1 16S rRNA (guanine(527)-N(7))-methyltransferase RsmG [Lachnospiraceae bacterium]